MVPYLQSSCAGTTGLCLLHLVSPLYVKRRFKAKSKTKHLRIKKQQKSGVHVLFFVLARLYPITHLGHWKPLEMRTQSAQGVYWAGMKLWISGPALSPPNVWYTLNCKNWTTVKSKWVLQYSHSESTESQLPVFFCPTCPCCVHTTGSMVITDN